MEGFNHKTTVVADGGKRPLSQFQNKAKWMGVLNALLQEVQELETASVPSIAPRYLADAEDWALDQNGDLVGMPRPKQGAAATDDEAYRPLIYGKIAQNVSHGSTPEVLNILRSLQATQARAYDVYPASLTVNFVPSGVLEECHCTRDILRGALHPISLDISAHTASPFGFQGDLSASGFGAGDIGEAI